MASVLLGTFVTTLNSGSTSSVTSIFITAPSSSANIHAEASRQLTKVLANCIRQTADMATSIRKRKPESSSEATRGKRFETAKPKELSTFLR